MAKQVFFSFNGRKGKWEAGPETSTLIWPGRARLGKGGMDKIHFFCWTKIFYDKRTKILVLGTILQKKCKFPKKIRHEAPEGKS